MFLNIPMTSSFYKQNSNAKLMNHLNYQITTGYDHVKIKNNKSNFTLKLEDNELGMIEQNEHNFYREYYRDILLVNKALNHIFETNENKYHKYLNLSIKCTNIYTENALKEWIYHWFESKEINIENVKYKTELENIFIGFKKCKIQVN
jgi:hypothetical protein